MASSRADAPAPWDSAVKAVLSEGAKAAAEASMREAKLAKIQADASELAVSGRF